MIQPTAPKSLTSYVDVNLLHLHAVDLIQAFQEIAGENLENLDHGEVWSIVTALCESARLAESIAEDEIDTPEIIEAYGYDLSFSKLCEKCLEALDGFPLNQVNALMIGILSVNRSHS